MWKQNSVISNVQMYRKLSLVFDYINFLKSPQFTNSILIEYNFISFFRSYFANSDNFINQWFVKCGWFWTGILLSSFIYFTSNTYGCGRMNIVKNNLSRLAIASAVWFSMTSLFNAIEAKTGMCEYTQYRRKDICINNGHLWRGFDLSGHCFLLIFCNLVMHEEGKAYLGWEKIKDFLRNEEHKRLNDDSSRTDTPLSKLKNEEFRFLRYEYRKYSTVLYTKIALFVIEFFYLAKIKQILNQKSMQMRPFST